MESDVRLAELMAVMSKATDLGMGYPVETALSSCVAAMRLAAALGLDTDTRRDVYYLALIRHIGCNAGTHVMAAALGDELRLRREFAAIDPGDPGEIGALAARHIQQARTGFAMAGLPELMQESFSGHCEVAQRLAERMGLPGSLIESLGQIYERWDGKGHPRGLRGEAVALPVRVVSLAADAVWWSRLGGPDAALTAVGRRSGAYGPLPAECFEAEGASILAGLDDETSWQTVIDLEPADQRRLGAEDFERCCEAIADFADVKSPYTVGHSHGVAALAAGAGSRLGLPGADVTQLRQAALLHDIGRSGVSAGIWGKPGPLSEREWEQVRLHPYYTERVLAQPDSLAPLAHLASLHHERLNGAGYHRAVEGASLSLPARILAAADAYHAMLEPRPHRAALEPAAAASELWQEVRAGRLDGDAVNSVLAEAGHRVAPSRRERPAGLSRREVEVLRLLARGNSNREIAERLFLAPDTVKRHVQHIYDKTGLSTRAGATLFAVENSLL